MINRGESTQRKKLAPARGQPTRGERRRRDPRQLRRQVYLRDQRPRLGIKHLDDAAGRPPRQDRYSVARRRHARVEDGMLILQLALPDAFILLRLRVPLLGLHQRCY